jgi:hypothetical protein
MERALSADACTAGAIGDWIWRDRLLLCLYTILKNYSLFFLQYILFYLVSIFFNFLCSLYSKFILYINYHPYFVLFTITNFFSLIPISTTITNL